MKKIIKKDRKYVNILGININSTPLKEVLARVEYKVTHNDRFYITTPNPEHVLASKSNINLKEALNNADFAVADGIGLKFASLFLYGKNLKVIHGRNLFVDLIRLSDEKGWRVFLLSGLDKEARIVAAKLSREYKRVKIETAVGPILTQEAEPVTETDRKVEKEAIEAINKFQPHLLFVAFGNPKQEIWIHKNLSKLNVGGAMVVGGTFRYIAGLSPLPPKWMEKLGLEWLYRLVTEPYRIGRIFNAVVVFPLRVFWSKLSS